MLTVIQGFSARVSLHGDNLKDRVSTRNKINFQKKIIRVCCLYININIIPSVNLILEKVLFLSQKL